jgi:hypothetical protein
MTYTAHEIHGGYYETYKCVEVASRLRELGLTDSTIARLKKWFASDSEHVTAVYIGRGEWMDGCTGEAIA